MIKKLILAVALSLAIIGGSFSIASAQCCFNPFSWFSCGCGCGCAPAAVTPAPRDLDIVPQPQSLPPDRDIEPKQDRN